MAVAQPDEGACAELAMAYAASRLRVSHSLHVSALKLYAFVRNDI